MNLLGMFAAAANLVKVKLSYAIIVEENCTAFPLLSYNRFLPDYLSLFPVSLT